MTAVGTSIAVVVSYLVGSIPVGFLVVRARKGIDIRTQGSGNIGATNAARVLGTPWFFLVFTLDVLKGLGPCLVVGLIEGRPWLGQPASPAVVLAGLAAIAGHNWPLFLGFRGGKGVATSCGVCAYVLPTGLLAGVVVWAIAALIWRYVSLASILAAAGVLAAEIAVNARRLAEAKYTLGFAVLASAIVVWRHAANIRRLLDGTENRLGGKKPKPGPEDEPSPPEPGVP